MKYITTTKRNDGFGAQYQHFIYAIFYASLKGCIFVYRPIENIEHNYENDENYINKIEELMNIKGNFLNYNELSEDNKKEVLELNVFPNLYPEVEKQIDLLINSDAIKNIKKCFWENKLNYKKYYNDDFLNVAVHIRTVNSCDGIYARPELYKISYVDVINAIRETYSNFGKKILFHIYSQGNIENFKCYENEDTIFHLDEDLTKTYMDLVTADILVTSASSLSYTAALLSDGIIFYRKFWHPPCKNWIVW